MYKFKNNIDILKSIYLSKLSNSGNIKVSPLFILAGSNFHLQTVSPCVDAGLNIGLSYIGKNPDIGVYENSLNNPQIMRDGNYILQKDIII